MANHKFKATAQLFLETSDAKSDAKKFVTDLKQQLSSIETAADKMTVFKDLVAYIAQVDQNLASLIAKNGDKFKHIFDGMDESFRNQFEELFELSDENLQKLDVLHEKLATLTPKSGVAEIRKFAIALNQLFTLIGAEAPLNIDEFKNKATQAQIDKIMSTLSDFETKWVEVVSKLKDGFSLGGAGSAVSGGVKKSAEEIKTEIDNFEVQLQRLKVLRSDISNTLSDFNKFDKEGSLNIKFDGKDITNSIKEIIVAKEKLDKFVKDGGDTKSVDYQELLSQYLHSAVIFSNIFDNLATASPGTNKNKIFKKIRMGQIELNGNRISLADLRDVVSDDLEGELPSTLSNFQSSIDTQIDNITGKVQGLRESLRRIDSDNSVISGFTRITQEADKSGKAIQKVMYHLGNLLNGVGSRRDTFGDMPYNLTDAVADNTKYKQYGFGVLGGGLFGVSDPSTIDATKVSRGNFLHSIDLSKYNMYLADTEERATNLMNFLSTLQKYAFKSAAPNYTGFDEQLKDVNVDTLYDHFKVVFDEADLTKERFNSFINEMVNLLRQAGLKFDVNEGIIDFTSVGDLANSENISTRFMKMLGYQGVNVGGTSFDGFGQGSVLFDFDPSDIVGYFNTAEQAINDFQKRINDVSWDGSNEQLIQYRNAIDSIIARLKEHKSMYKDDNEAAHTTISQFDTTISRLSQIQTNIDNILAGKSISDGGVFTQITTGAQQSGDAAQEAATKLKAFYELADLIQSKDMSGEMTDIDIGRYTERLNTAEQELKALGDQGVITSEELDKVNDALTKSRDALSGSTARNEEERAQEAGRYDYTYASELYQAEKENDALQQDNAALKEQNSNLEKQLAETNQMQMNAVGQVGTAFKEGSAIVSTIAETEIARLDDLLKKINDIKAAVYIKTDAFREEQGVVDRAVDSEAESLNRLKIVINTIKELVVNFNAALDGYNRDLAYIDSTQTVFKNTIEMLADSLNQIYENILRIPTAIRESSNALQLIIQAFPAIVSDANNLKDTISNIGSDINTESFRPVADALSQMVVDAQNIKDILGDIGDNFGAQGNSALNVKFGDTLKVDLTADSTGVLQRISEVVAAIQTKINAQGVDGISDPQNIIAVLSQIAQAVEAIQTVVQKDTGIESDGKNSVKQTEPLTDNHAEQNKLSEQELAVLGNLNEALGRLNEYLTSNLSNNTSEGAKQENSAVSNIYHLLSTKLSSQPASERTLNEIQSLIGLLLDKSKIEKDLMTTATQYSDLQSFIHDNIDALQAIGINSNEFANVLWREANYKREDFQPLEMAIEDAINVLRNQVPENILDGWFRDANSAYKPRLENLALSNKDVRNAALNVMWDNYKNYSGKDIGFKEFLYSSIPVYRGKDSEKYVDEDQVVSFTFDKSIAEKFGKHVFETMIRPIDTIGAYQTTGETEVMVRRDFLEQLPQFQTWLNNMSSGLEQSYVQAAGKPSDIQGGSDYALESTLQIVKGVLDKIAGNTEAIISKELEGANTNPLPPDTGADTVPDQQNGTDNAWVSTLTNIYSVLGQILKALTDGTTLSTFIQPLSDAVAALKDVSNGIIQHQKAQKSDTRVAQARIADPIQQDLIVEKAKDAVQTLGTDVQVASLDALADGIVRVSGAVKNANGIWEGFTVKVNQADEAVDFSIKKQSAFAKSLNRMDKLSGSDDEDSNPYVYDKAEVEARAKKHLDEYAAQGKKATVQFKDSGRYTITILEEIDGLSKQIFQTFDENDKKIEHTTVTMSHSQKMKLDNFQKKLIDNGITNGLISDKDADYQAYQQALDALNNMTDAYSKMDNLSDKQIEDWKKQIKLVQQLGGQVETLIKQRKTANDAKIFESDRSKKLSRFDLDNAKLQKDINIPESFNQQIKDARTAIESAVDDDALKIAINNWETLKNQIHAAAVQQDLYSEKSKNTPGQFATDLKSQKTAFNKYKRDTEDAIDVTDELKNKLIELETKLGNINDAAGLRAWQKEFKSVKDEIAATQSSYKRDKKTYSQQIMGQANAELKSAGIKKDSTNLNADQQKIIDKYNELEEQIGEYNKKVKAKQQAEISGIEQTKAALFGLIEAYKQANNIVDAKGNPSRQAYGTAQVQNFNAKYNSLQTRAQNVGLTDNFAAVQNLANAYEKLKEAQAKFKVGEDLTTDAGKAKVEAFKQAQIECNRYAAELNKVIKQEEQLSAGADYASPVNEDFDDSLSGRKKALEDFVNAIPDTAIGKFNADFTELTYTVKNGDGTFTNMTATLNAARDTIFATAGETEKATTAFGKFLNEVKGKARGILQYLMSMTGFQEIFQQIRQGVQYVREIDAALTELKKVTNGTNATYDAFLQTMSKTAGAVGSTVSELTTMAAEWARLGSIIKSAPLYSNI